MSASNGARSVDAVVIGAGQAGLSMSHLLRQAGREHLVLERRETLGGGWQDRWDGFQLVSPNWTLSLPGSPYDGPDPDGFMPRDEIVERLRRYGDAVGAPVELGVEVTRLAARENGATRFRLETSAGAIDARTVVVAAGGFQVPHLPPVASDLPPDIQQLHVHDYRRESDLPPGGVLVVGSGQSGVQVADELVAAGRRVVLAVGRCGRVPRRYRGRDIFFWLDQLMRHGEAAGVPLPTADKLPNPAFRYACNPHLSGHRGGHTVNLRAMGRDGVTLVGRLDAAVGSRVSFGPGLSESLAAADRFFVERFRDSIETLISFRGIDAPDDAPEEVVDFEPPEIAELDLAAEGIGTVLWTCGYRLGFRRWIDLPIFDEFGFPIGSRGMPAAPGLAFLGVPWQMDQASGNLVGVARDAEYLASRMA